MYRYYIIMLTRTFCCLYVVGVFYQKNIQLDEPTEQIDSNSLDFKSQDTTRVTLASQLL